MANTLNEFHFMSKIPKNQKGNVYQSLSQAEKRVLNEFICIRFYHYFYLHGFISASISVNVYLHV